MKIKGAAADAVALFSFTCRNPSYFSSVFNTEFSNPINDSIPLPVAAAIRLLASICTKKVHDRQDRQRQVENRL
jgi:hypothetical protein